MANEYPMQPGFYNMDCIEAMKKFPDDFFDLAVVDPPYGDAEFEEDSIGGGRRFGQRFDRYKDPEATNNGKRVERTGGTWAEKYGKNIIAWDVAPGPEYFDELFRISKNQIVWGGNYFRLPPCRCFLVWRKLTISESFSMAMAEYAWTSFNSNAKVFECAPQGQSGDRFHPTQKPIALYSWILSRYAQPGFKILDTHVGSASSLIACHRAGLEYWGFEINEHYYKKACKRLDNEKSQINMAELLNGKDTNQQEPLKNQLSMFEAETRDYV